MKPTTLATSLSLCLIGIGLAACPDNNTTPGPTASYQDRPAAETPPPSNRRAEVVRSGIDSVDVGDRVYFAYDSSVLSADAQRTLQRQAVWLKSGPPAT